MNRVRYLARNRVLSEKTAKDIDELVERVLWRLAHPEPPLLQEDVRELLKLDLDFYTAVDPGILQETIRRIRVAGVQVCKSPTLLIDAICKVRSHLTGNSIPLDGEFP